MRWDMLWDAYVINGVLLLFIIPGIMQFQLDRLVIKQPLRHFGMSLNYFLLTNLNPRFFLNNVVSVLEAEFNKQSTLFCLWSSSFNWLSVQEVQWSQSQNTSLEIDWFCEY